MAFELIDTYPIADYSEFEKDYSLNLAPSSLPVINTYSYSDSGMSRSTNPMDSFATALMASSKEKGEKALQVGSVLKTVAAAGELFNGLISYTATRKIASQRAANEKQNVANQMLAIDNQIEYYKGQITDKFAQTMARNAVTMATRNLRVTAGNLLEQTKDAAYDATKDIQTLESNAELKKIALRSEAKQADVAKKLTKTLATTGLIQSLADVGLSVGTSMATGGYGNLFETGGSLNESIYGS